MKKNKLLMLVEFLLESDFIFDSKNENEREWFFDSLLKNNEDLRLHSNEVGDILGNIKVLLVNDSAKIKTTKENQEFQKNFWLKLRVMANKKLAEIE